MVLMVIAWILLVVAIWLTLLCTRSDVAILCLKLAGLVVWGVCLGIGTHEYIYRDINNGPWMCAFGVIAAVMAAAID